VKLDAPEPHPDLK